MVQENTGIRRPVKIAAVGDAALPPLSGLGGLLWNGLWRRGEAARRDGLKRVI